MAKAKILVLDQDISWTLMISEALIKEDYEVFSANRATDALLLLQVRSAGTPIRFISRVWPAA